MTALLFVLPIALLVVARRGRVDLGVLVALPLGQWLAGAYASGVSGASAVGDLVAFACVGYLVLALPARLRPGPTTRARTQWRMARVPVTAIVLGWTVLHFARAGIPILSGSAETDRFDLAASGLLGIPSRFFLYVLPMAAIWGACAVRKISDDRCVTVLWVALVLSRLAGGMKSGLLEVAIYALVVAVRRHGSLRLGAFLRARSLASIVLVLVGAGAVAQTYGTVQARSDGTVVDYLIERLTVGTVSAAGHTVDQMEFDHPPVLDDVGYYVPKYAGLQPSRVSLGRQVVASFYGLPVETEAVTTTVTLGLPVELYLNGGIGLVVVGSTAAGLLLRYLQRRLLAADGWAVGAIGMSIVVLIRIIGNGGMVFYLLNLLGSLALFAGTVIVARMMRPVVRERPLRRALTT